MPTERCRDAAVPAVGSRRAWRLVGALLAGLVALAAAGLPAARAAPTDGVELSPEAPATSNDLRDPQAHNSPDLAVDPTDPRFVALAQRLDAPEFSCALQLSGDGGRSWLGGEPLTALPDGVDHCYGPQVAFDGEGTLHYLFVGLSGAGNTPAGAWLTSSQDRGRTFTRPRQVLPEFSYQARLAMDRAAGRLHLVWLATGEGPVVGGLPPVHNPIMAAHSDDGGRTFSDPVEVSGPGQRRVVAPAVTVGADGQLHVAYYDLRDDVRDYQGLEGPVWEEPWAVEVATSHDGGGTFERTVVGEARPAERVMVIFTMPPPAIAADGSGRVYAAWHEAIDDGAGVAVATSEDAGRSWHEPVSVDGDGTHQLLPQVAAAPDGRVELAFFDRGADGQEHVQHITYAASSDRGRTFSSPLRLTTEPSDARSGPRFHLPVAQGMVEQGTGLALHAGDHAALLAWPDTRFAVPGTAQQDLYTRRLVRPARGEEPAAERWWVAAGGAAVAVVAVLLLVLAGRRRRTPVAALLAVLAAGCQPGHTAGAPLPDAPASVEVTLDEYVIGVDGPLVPGRTVVEARNRGDEAHQLVLVRLPDAVESMDTLLASARPLALAPTYVVPARAPGGTGRFAVDLEPGRYGLLCFLGDGTPHHRRGMATELVVER